MLKKKKRCEAVRPIGAFVGPRVFRVNNTSYFVGISVRDITSTSERIGAINPSKSPEIFSN